SGFGRDVGTDEEMTVAVVVEVVIERELVALARLPRQADGRIVSILIEEPLATLVGRIRPGTEVGVVKQAADVVVRHCVRVRREESEAIIHERAASRRVESPHTL